MKHNIKLASLVGSLLILFSCSNEIEVDPNMYLYDNTLGNLDEVELRKEISLLMGQVLLDKESRDFALDYAKFKNDNSESISLAALAGNESKIPMEEKVALHKARKLNALAEPSSSTFKSNVIATYHAMNGQLPVMQQMMQIHNMSVQGASASLGGGASSIFDSDAFAKHEIYFPYEEEFDWEKVNTFAMSWAPKNLERGSSDAHLFDVSTKTYSKDPIRVDDDYAYRKPVALIMPIFDDEDWVAIDPTPYIPPNKQYWLTQNVDHTKISQKDVLKTIIPRIKLTKHYSGWPSKSKIILYRVSGDLSLNADGTIDLSKPGRHKLLNRYKFKRRDIKKGRWKKVNVIFDGDWDMHEADQQIVLFSYRHWDFKSSSAEGTVSIAYDSAKKKFVPEAKFAVNFKITLGKTDLKYNNEVSRRDALSHIIGDHGSGTYNDGGVHYTVKTADALHYYFKHYYTNVPE